MPDISKEDHDKAVAQARAEGVAEGRKAGAADASTRIAAIMSCDEAKGRETLASHLAYKTEVSVDDAKGMLAAAPAANAQTAAPPAQTYEQRKADAGAGGFVEGGQTAAMTTKDIWSKANAATTPFQAV